MKLFLLWSALVSKAAADCAAQVNKGYAAVQSGDIEGWKALHADNYEFELAFDLDISLNGPARTVGKNGFTLDSVLEGLAEFEVFDWTYEMYSSEDPTKCAFDASMAVRVKSTGQRYLLKYFAKVVTDANDKIISCRQFSYSVKKIDAGTAGLGLGGVVEEGGVSNFIANMAPEFVLIGVIKGLDGTYYGADGFMDYLKEVATLLDISTKSDGRPNIDYNLVNVLNDGKTAYLKATMAYRLKSDGNEYVDTYNCFLEVNDKGQYVSYDVRIESSLPIATANIDKVEL